VVGKSVYGFLRRCGRQTLLEDQHLSEQKVLAAAAYIKECKLLRI
jgi:hypothetical protein